MAEVFEPLLGDARYKGAWGGRGSGKSHHYAEALVERCLLRPRTRWICVREIQQTLKQSSKLLIEDKIKNQDLQKKFRILDDQIITPGDGVIIFLGMQNHTSDSIKSLEDFDGAWVDEAHRLSEKSLGLLRPTIRKPGSELWFSWNPESKKDPVEKLLRPERSEDRPRDSIVVEAHWWDNPWFPQVLREEMEYDKRRDPDRYAHVWLGQYQKASQARVFSNWKIESFETPSDARFYFGGDFGFSIDPTVLIRCWIRDRTLFVDYEAWKIGCEIDHTPALYAGSDSDGRWVNPLEYEGIPGATQWPIIADSSNPQAISYLQRFGFNVQPAIKGPGSIEEGVTFLKGYDIVVHPRCMHVADEMSTYSFKVDPKTEEVLPVLSDKKNHTIDSMRYAVELLRRSSYDTSYSWIGTDEELGKYSIIPKSNKGSWKDKVP